MNTVTRLTILLPLGLASLTVMAIPQSPFVKSVTPVTAPILGTPISVLPFTISQCGRYFLTECLTGVSGQHGVTIDADDVTLDLKGFSLTGVPGSLDGVHIAPARLNTTVCAGTVRNWGGDGIDSSAPTSFHLRVNGVTIDSNGGAGVHANDEAELVDCLARGNGLDGFTIDRSGHIENCIARLNGGDGFDASSGSVLTRCTADNNAGSGIICGGSVSASRSIQHSIGLRLIAGVAMNCEVSNSGTGIDVTSGVVVNCTAIGGDEGIVADNSAVRGCTVRFNDVVGIRANSHCTVVNNHCSENGLGVGGRGIITNTSSRIEGNTIEASDIGIEAVGPSNLILKNSSSAGFTLAPGNTLGPIVNIAAGGDLAAITDGNHPWANFRR